MKGLIQGSQKGKLKAVHLKFQRIRFFFLFGRGGLHIFQSAKTVHTFTGSKWQNNTVPFYGSILIHPHLCNELLGLELVL